jgi:hypothetical protein
MGWVSGLKRTVSMYSPLACLGGILAVSCVDRTAACRFDQCLEVTVGNGEHGRKMNVYNVPTYLPLVGGEE